ncbi:shikimate kinase AroK [Gammaproteobacteria bacterium]|nr:shikimate kinase AroK [Gammaproteobacteria bacterium]
MKNTNNIILIGPMGTGKTTIGRQLAKNLSVSFYDSDHEIEKRTGVKIALIFEIEGVEGFRRRETQILNELSQMNNIVLSTGGGAVTRAENRKTLKNNGHIIYLKSSPEILFKRTADDKNRPLLQTDDRLSQIRKILAEREPIYIEMADEVIDSEKKSSKQIIQKILEQIDNENH